MLLVLIALLAGGCAFTATLWLTGFGAASGEAVQRLTRLKSPEDQQQAPSGPGLRRRASVRFGGINLVSGNLLEQWGQQLERAGLTLNAREYFVLRATVGLVAALLAFVFLPIPQLALLFAPLGFLLVGFWVKMRVASRRRKLESQLTELLQMLSSGLRAGFGLLQALDGACEQAPAPLVNEIRRTLRDTAMGASIEQALTALNDRIGSPDFDIVVTAILIQRGVGGNLAEILDNVAHTMRERERIRGEIRTLTSQQRMTGYVVGAIPVGLGGVFFLINPDFMKLLFTDSLGHIMLGGAVVLEVIGFFVISRIVNIEV